MTFVCPRCFNSSLNIASSIELPPDNRSDEITVQTLRCSKCGLASLGVYEETRRGNLESESFSHRGYYLDYYSLVSLEKIIKQCQSPKKPTCKCKTHRSMGCVNKFGRWSWLQKIPHKGTFKIKIK